MSLFIAIDDFCIALQTWKQTQPQFKSKVTNTPTVNDSELLTILVFYQCSGYKCFQYYYQNLVANDMRSYFPQLISYERFVALLPRLLPGLYVFLKMQTMLSRRSNQYFIDSKKIVVCDNRRIHSHRVFQDSAKRGKTSTGWFYGFKLHLVINNYGQIINFLFTQGNVADNNKDVLKYLLAGLQGQCFADKGYLSTLFEEFYLQGLQLVTKVRAKMKNKLIKLSDYMKLRKRALIESVNDILTSVFDLEHTRHRSPVNALAHMLSALIAYCFYEDKPAVFIEHNQILLLA
ncbi:IS982 family transposase [Rhodocytophaga aerolata]|uniref:IS982 family transposase n=1 Tax=Rhodocytophaga aerolata TaxID=455078 RepID=A0ABT8R3M1_9BACT|nr:IS982 family transposase [Rhodocytophaga aerolata]MDO1446701.1 IS982 family transposase [Rhodocytophaga aerolata]